MTTEQTVLQYIDSHKDNLYNRLAQLIKINSENYITDGNEIDCAYAVKAFYDELGLQSEVYFPDDIIKHHNAYLANRGTDHRPNVAGLYKGTEGKKRVMLAAHTDTVPIGSEDKWTIPPLSGVIKDGRIYGRGSGDNKFGLISSYFALKAIIECGIKLKHNVILSGYCDEEYGGGNGSIASCVKYPCDVYINLDGGNSEIWICSVGGQALAAELKAIETQDSAELIIDGLNIIKSELKTFQRNRYRELGKNKYFKGTDMHRSCLRITSFECGDAGTDLAYGRMDFVFYTDKTKDRVYKELTQIEQKLKKELKNIGILFKGFTPISRFFDYECASEDDPAIKLMTECASHVEEKKINLTGACLSDYFLYLQYGSKSSLSYGIFRDFKRYGGAHQPDEYIECKDFVNHTKALSLFLLRWCGYEID